MKKKRLWWFILPKSELLKTFLVMKIVTIMLFVFVLGAHSMGLAQHKMNVNFKEITYENLFQEIRTQTGFVVMYNSDVLNKNTRVAADF